MNVLYTHLAATSSLALSALFPFWTFSDSIGISGGSILTSLQPIALRYSSTGGSLPHFLRCHVCSWRIRSILTIQDVIKVSTATEPWGVWDLPAVCQTDVISEFYLVKGVGESCQWESCEPRTRALISELLTSRPTRDASQDIHYAVHLRNLQGMRNSTVLGNE